MDRRERLDDPEESLRMALESYASQLWTALPASVVSVNLAAQTVSVQPTIQGSVADPAGNVRQVNLPLLVDVPLVWPKAGGFALTFPVAPGDEVLVVFACRCIDSWWQSGGIGAPAEARMHDLSDGFAILAPTSQPKKPRQRQRKQCPASQLCRQHACGNHARWKSKHHWGCRDQFDRARD